MSSFWDVFPVLVIFPTFAYMLKYYLDYRIKRQLIDKGMVDEKVKFLNYNEMEQYAPSSLKWGLVSTFTGLSLFLMWVLPISYRDGELILGALLISAGLGLLVYYFIAMTRKNMAKT